MVVIRPPEVLRSTVRARTTSWPSDPVSILTGRFSGTFFAQCRMSPGETNGATRSTSPWLRVRNETPIDLLSCRATVARISSRPVCFGRVTRSVTAVPTGMFRFVLTRIPVRLTSMTCPTPTRPSAASTSAGQAVRIRGERRRSRESTAIALLCGPRGPYPIEGSIVLTPPGYRIELSPTPGG